MTAILRHWSLGGEAGKSGWKPAIFINGPLLPEEEIVSFLSFLPVSPWVLQLNGITSIRISSLLSFSYHFPSPERNCWPLYPGPSLGVLTQESDTYEPRILRQEHAWARRPSGWSLKWIECTTSILRTLWRPSGSLTSISSSSRLVSSKGPT